MTRAFRQEVFILNPAPPFLGGSSDDKIIRIPNEVNFHFTAPIARFWVGFPDACFEAVQGHVRQNWRAYSTLWCSVLSGMQDMLLDKPGFQPLVQNGLFHGDM